MPASQPCLEVLGDDDALALLASRHLGRIAFAHEHWPVILPVNYLFEDPTVVIRTDDGIKLTDAPFNAVAFEVDDADPGGQWGWSVLIQGPAFDITSADDDRSTKLRSTKFATWAPGERGHWLSVTAVNFSGRYFGDIPALNRTVNQES